jgi:hypothetical protein
VFGRRHLLREIAQTQGDLKELQLDLSKDTRQTRELVREMARRQDVREEEFRVYRQESRRLLQAEKARTEDLREFIREILLRNEKFYTAIVAEVNEARAQIRANTEAVLGVLDRLNGSEGTA